MSHSDPRPNVAFVVAHPDDVAFSFGGTAWLLHDRYRLHVFCASKGERGYPWQGPGSVPPSAEVAAIRAGEEARACALLGAELTFLDQLDGEIFAGREVCGQMAAHLAAIAPVALFTHNPLEKADHAAVYGIATRALHLAQLFWTTELYMAVEYGPTFNPKCPDLYVNISSVIEDKRRLVYCHPSHAESGEGLEVFLDRNRIMGRLAWCDYVEAYWSGWPLMAERWNRKAGSILMDLPHASI